MSEMGYVVVGGPIHRAGAYIIDKFLENQKKIQDNYPASELVLATVEKEFVEELEEMLSRWGVKGRVILYKTVKPDYAQIWIWNVACGREAIRQYVLSQTNAGYLLNLDTDMVFDPSVISVMLKEIQGYDVVAGGYAGRLYGNCIGFGGCSLFTRETLKRIQFRCYEFRNHQAIDEGDTVSMDLFSLRLKVKRGYFVAIDHYRDSSNFRHTDPHPIPLLGMISNWPLLRYILFRLSILLKYNLSQSFYTIFNRLRRT